MNLSKGNFWSRAGFLAAAGFVALALGASAGRAADDGYAPLWTGIGASLGVAPGDQGSIDYREHGRLVLPKSKVLPLPGTAAAAAPNWPQDPDVVAAEQARLAALKPNKHGHQWRYRSQDEPAFDAVGLVTVNVNAGTGPARQACNGRDKTGNCADQRAGTALALEPDREWLTDPPPGYRAPIAPVKTPAAQK